MARCTVCQKHFFKKKRLFNGVCGSCLLKKASDLENNLKKKENELHNTKNDLKEAISKIPSDVFEKERLSLENAALKEENEKIGCAVKAASEKLSDLNKKILVAEDAVELESFSLYTPKFDFANAAQYKVALDSLREKQKTAIKIGDAWECNTCWKVEGSESKGKRFTEGVAKMAIRTFNAECDNAVSSVRFSNYERCEARIIRAFEVINNANKTSKVYLTDGYLNLKIEELKIALEYQIKKEEEKEAAKELRAQQREEAKLAKEIEEARKETEKEKKHYQNALSKIASQLSSAKDEDERAALLEKEKELKEGLSSVEEKLADIDYRQENQKAGYVYIISNIGSFGEGVYKIGMTRRLDPQERIDELGDASVPFNFDIHAMIFSSDAPKLEAALHRAFEDRRVNKVNNRREYFRVSLDEIKKVVKNNHGETVEFIETPAAAQYRESILME